MGAPRTKRELPSALIGGRRPLQAKVTRTRKVPSLRLPLSSVAVQRTVVKPSGKNDPDAGVHTTSGEGSLSSTADTTYVTLAPVRVVACAFTVPGRTSTGGRSSR